MLGEHAHTGHDAMLGRPLAAWDTSAAVRTQVARLALAGNDGEGHYFSHRLLTVLGHPGMQRLGQAAVRKWEAISLNRYMQRIEWVEMRLVNPAALCIVERANLPEAAGQGAYKIYVDEGYHAFMSAELRIAVARRFGIDAGPQGPRGPLLDLLQWIDSLEGEMGSLALITVASLNEMLITDSLLQANDCALLPAVRESIRVHAEDEARHHGFFLRLFPRIWQDSRADARNVVAAHLPWILLMLLAPDRAIVAADLATLGIDFGEAERIAVAAHPVVPALAEVERATRSCLGLLAEMGLCTMKELTRAHETVMHRGRLDYDAAA